MAGHRIRLGVKRVIDLTVAAVLLLLLAPLFLAVAIAIKLESPGPVFFRQKRRGKGFVPFTIVKFRSLLHNAPDPHEGYEMLESDPRITRVGAFLRATSIDELPQLWNVLEGSMSLVGPRPLVEWESQRALERFAQRFDVKPGLTGWSQVSVRNSVGFDARCERDLDYVRRFGLWLDLEVLLKTPLSLLQGETIYPDDDRR